MLDVLGDDSFYIGFIFYLKITVIVDDNVELCRPVILPNGGRNGNQLIPWYSYPDLHSPL